jgi:hypothetical protein
MMADDSKHSCLLMQDAVQILRDANAGQLDIDKLSAMVTLYASMQRAYTADEWLAVGLPDWRLKNIPALYDEVLGKSALLQADGLTDEDIQRLHTLRPALVGLCKEIATYGVSETIEHGDFTDRNIMNKDTNLIINDWGDAAVSHPFLSMGGFLASIARHYKLDDTSPEYIALRDTYLLAWKDIVQGDEAVKLLSMASALRHVTFAFSFARVSLDGVTIPVVGATYLAETLRRFIVAVG